jgi:DNA-binding NtrC family response regulator
MTKKTVLIVDDESYVRDSLAEVASAEGLRALVADGPPAALKLLASEDVHAILTDLRMPLGDGLALVEDARTQAGGIPIVVLTGHGSVADAVAAMKAGAFDFLQKPVDPEQLGLVLRRALRHQELAAQVSYLRAAAESQRGPGLVGDSPGMRKVREGIAQVAPTDATVLVTGESGTGKELVAEEVHRQSRRATRNLVRVNCAAIPESLFESEFFGHRRGSFSGAVADRTGRFVEAESGTLVLDEVGTLRTEMQAKLLRVLEGGEFQVVGESRTRVADVRVVALTNEPLAAQVQAGAFRADLYYRLNIFPIHVPPLRTRKEDIPAIATSLLEQSARGRAGNSAKASASAIEPATFQVLASYDWPGNVRELRNVLERASIVAGERAIDAGLVRALLEGGVALEPNTGPGDLVLRKNLDAAEKQLVERALERAAGRKKDAAALLGIDPRNLGYYLRKHGIGEGEGGAR